MVQLNAIESQIFRALPETERSEAIAQRIEVAVSIGLLPAGDRLPNEIDLASLFGVAGETLRDALAMLRDRGIVVTRRGRSGGTFVVGVPAPSIEELRDRMRAHTIAELRDLGDEHAAVAAASARLATDRAHSRDIDRLALLAGALADAATPEERRRLDSRFHIEIAVAAQSQRLMATEIRLQGEVSELLWAPLAAAVDQASIDAEHRELVGAVEAGDAQKAQRLAMEHARRGVHHLIDAKLALSYPGRAGTSEG